MKTVYSPDLKAHLTTGEGERVRHIRHSQEYWPSEESVPRIAAGTYLNEMAETFQIPGSQLRNLHIKASFFDPREQGIEYQLHEEKHAFDSTTVAYYQTYMNVPVWRSGLSVKIKQNPNRIVGATNNSEEDIHGTLPPVRTIDTFRKVFQQVILNRASVAVGLGETEEADETASFLGMLINVQRIARARSRRATTAAARDETQILSGKFFFYKYNPKRRYAGKPSPAGKTNDSNISEEQEGVPLPSLPVVSRTIKTGQSYLVGEVIFKSNAPGFHGLVWLVLVELETRSILYIECMSCGVNGMVFRRDPIVKTGNLTITSDDANAALNPERDDMLLNDIDPPVAGTQRLRGTFVDIQELTISHADPDIAPPTEPTGTDFDYDARTNNFGAVNAYYHETELFRTIESLGFPHGTYFDGTTFPIPVDHRALGDVINAHWTPNGTGGTGHMCFALCDTTNTALPLLRAVDPWVHWHEMGGHGTLGDHVGGGSFGFAHSAGDGLAALQMDPESQLRALALPERFRYAPFRPFTTERRFDRPVATWAWGGGANDDLAYGSEQILATCHFRIYRSIGGDHSNLGRRQFASRMMTYLVLRAIGNLTAMTNPGNWDPVAMASVPGRGAQLWCEELQDTDLENWVSEGISGGAYNKVIRWAFEKQGSYQPPAAPTPVTTAGAPPAVDVYIDDGRNGEYQFQEVHWHNISMWNRNSADGMTGHQNAIEGAINYMYCKVKNRGTTPATSVVVKGYHSLPGAGLTWPTDFTGMTPAAGLTVSSIGSNNTEEVTVGPFEWIPNINVYGHDCVLMIASTAGDPSNIDNFTGTETVEEWRLVPNDNNVGQRNVTVEPGGGGMEALFAALDGAVFFAGNSYNRRANMEVTVQLPKVLASRGWRIDFPGLEHNKFALKAGEKRKLTLSISKGLQFTADDIRNAADRHININLYGNGILLGGMTYQLDPDLKQQTGGKHGGGDSCKDAAATLLDCLTLPGKRKVKSVRVKKVSIDIEMDHKRDCD